MVQEQLVDYVSSQMKLGVSRDAIKSALVSAGWVSADVEDTLKKVMGGGQPSGGAMPVGGSQPAGTMPATAAMGSMAARPAQPQSSISAAGKPMGASAGVNASASPQMIRVSDLVSGSPAISKPAASTASSSAASATTTKTSGVQFGGKISGNTFTAAATPAMGGGAATAPAATGGNKMNLIGGIIAAVLIIVCAGAAWYFYSGNAALAAKVSSLTTQSASVTAQLTSLQSQVDASSTGFAAQLASLTAANADLALNLSFYAVPLGGASSSAGTALPITISGSLSGGGKAPYALTTPRGAKVFIANSSDATIAPQLKSLVGQTILLTGSYVPGSDSMTVSAVSSSTTP